MFKKQTEMSELDEAIKLAVLALQAIEPEAPEYAHVVDQLSKLYKLKEIDSPKKRVSPDTLALIVGNLAGILIIVGYEHLHVLPSKALNFVMKLK